MKKHQALVKQKRNLETLFNVIIDTQIKDKMY